MFVVQLKFTEARARAPQFMEVHNAWLKRGFDDGIFLLAGSLQPRLGGAILVHGVSLDALQQRLEDDPFVAEGIVSTEIMEIDPGRADERLQFLVA
ncbi:YciI family protein [Rhizobium cremeum]|uniref:YciI family protein n=1 Tax=Rhizobium cremeum TaxID=2813827 RepID=UPI000DD5125C